MKKETIILGADHAGFDVKEFIKEELLKMNYPIRDVGTTNKTTRVDYPDYAERVAVEVKNNYKLPTTKVFRKVLADGRNSAILLSFSSSFGRLL